MIKTRKSSITKVISEYYLELSMRDLRKPSLVMFIESFLQKYEIKNDEDEETGKDNKFKKGK